MQNKKSMKHSSEWKEKNEKYLFELQKFLDIADNIRDEELKKRLINQMIKCDKVITELAEEIINN